MQKLIHVLVFATFISSPLLADDSFSNGSSYDRHSYRIKINWQDPNTLQRSVALKCGNNGSYTVYSAVEIIVPGIDTDFVVDEHVHGIGLRSLGTADITDGEGAIGCDVRKYISHGFVTYRFERISLASCIIEVQPTVSLPGPFKGVKRAIYKLHKDCQRIPRDIGW